ncbi:MAG: hypothetical protein B6D56_06745 [Candidatus Omnitrophica bacterium 4484_70.1]|nr:MAG: hypothetical protein B6D56_06745 [Candidatus Omnitrophica bacterium 4484_70.1]
MSGRCPTLSILLLTYNHEKFIAQCVQSVLAQTFSDWEMIVVDDGSSDHTVEIIKKYVKKDKRVKWILHKNNYGIEKLYLSHNEALERARGKFITVLEGDDFWPDYRLKLQIQSFRKKEIVLCHGHSIWVQNNKCLLHRCRFVSDIRRNFPLGSALKAFLLGFNPLNAQTVMVRKETLLKIRGFRQVPSLYLVDYPTWMEMALLGEFAFVNQPLGYWRRHSSQITKIYKENLRKGFIRAIEEFIHQNREKLDSLPVNLEKYIKYYGYNAYFYLCKIYIQRKEWSKVKEIVRRMRITLNLKKYVESLSLILKVYSPWY